MNGMQIKGFDRTLSVEEIGQTCPGYLMDFFGEFLEK
jgi:hypothetical protein